MPLRLPDKWIWDFWLVRRDDEHHIFYLQAPRSLARPALRHHNASVGHAVSRDLRSWQVLPDALHPGPAGSFDDLAIWTGSAIEHENRWYMLYTGVGRAEEGLVQRIGLAVSDDLIDWHKHPANPVIEADPRWYALLAGWPQLAWRDPWLFREDTDGRYHALITARSCTGPPDGAGVIGHARSYDLIAWEVLPPLAAPGDFAQLEVPQLVDGGRRYEILFSCHAEDHSHARMATAGVAGAGTFALSAEHPFGPYSAPYGPLAPPDGSLGPLYAGKLVETAGGVSQFLASRGITDREFIGELTDPLPVHRDEHGKLIVVA